jgi:hypothetical protein
MEKSKKRTRRLKSAINPSMKLKIASLVVYTSVLGEHIINSYAQTR